jgi:hypothetical protein
MAMARGLRVASLALAMGLLLARGASADELRGKVTAVEPSAQTFTILTETGDRVTLKTQRSTEIQKAGEDMSLDELLVGSSVRVRAARDTDAVVAMRVDVEKASDSETPPVSATPERGPASARPSGEEEKPAGEPDHPRLPETAPRQPAPNER